MRTLFSAVNPLVPAMDDVLWSVLLLIAAAACVAAFVSLLRTRIPTSLATLVWIAIIVLIPLAGPAIWFANGRRFYRKPQAPGQRTAP